MTEVLDLVVMWALLQVLVVWWFAHAGEIQPVDSCPYPGCSDGPYITTNPEITKTTWSTWTPLPPATSL